MKNGRSSCPIFCYKNSLKGIKQAYWMAFTWSIRPRASISRSRFGGMSRALRPVTPPEVACIRTNFGQMTLGEFELLKEPEEEIDPIDWAYSSAQAHNLALKEITELRARLDGEKGTIDKLNAQLQDFIKTKDETETAMLQQFMGLLNEKKRKIRDQNRLLAGAKVDKSTGKRTDWRVRVKFCSNEIIDSVLNSVCERGD